MTQLTLHGHQALIVCRWGSMQGRQYLPHAVQDRTRQSSATSIPHSPQRSAVSASSMLSDPAPPEHMPAWPPRTPSASDLSPSKDAASHSARSSRSSRG